LFARSKWVTPPLIERSPDHCPSGLEDVDAAEVLPQATAADSSAVYSMLNRWVEKELLGTLEELGAGCIAFSPLAQGLLTNKYLNWVPENSRAKA